jgi:hypothetical protein
MVCLLFMNIPDLSRNMPRCAQLRNSHGTPHAPPSGKPQAGRERAGGIPRVCRLFAGSARRKRQTFSPVTVLQSYATTRFSQIAKNRNAEWRTDPAGTVVRSTGTGNGQYRWVLHCALQILIS